MSEQLEHDEQELEEQLLRAGSASMHFKIIGARQNPFASDVDEQELQEHMSEADTEPALSEEGDEGNPDPSTPDIMNQADEDDMNLPGLSDEEEEGLPIALL
jgi:hypothetical protein